MPNKILVTYVTCCGSTKGVAEAIGRSLMDLGAEADVLPVMAVKDLKPYQAVVAGSPIQGAKWLPEGYRFVETNRATLSSKPFAAFLVCMTLAMPGAAKYRDHIANWMQPVRSLVKPAGEGYFTGALDIKKIPSFGDRIKFRMSVAFGVWSEGDHRDWNEIREWTKSIFPRLIG